MSTVDLDASDKAACAAAYASIRADVEGAIDWCLEKRPDDPFDDPVVRIAYEAFRLGQQAPCGFEPSL